MNEPADERDLGFEGGRVSSPADVIAIDGPGASGKGTVAARLAAALGWHLLDSGALYRVVGLIAQRRGIDFDDAESLAEAAHSADIAFKDAAGALPGASPIRVFVDGIDETDAIRSVEAEQPASRVAAVGAVREALFLTQRSCRRPPGLVADGRDMGTVVFPDARLKIFLTASAEARARRRFEQLKDRGASGSLRAPSGSGHENATGSRDAELGAIRASTEARDERDRTRPVSPLLPAPDAVTIDSTEMSIDDVMATVMALVRERGLGR